jgi:coenzyme PQQ precursor peptide PqqA
MVGSPCVEAELSKSAGRRDACCSLNACLPAFIQSLTRTLLTRSPSSGETLQPDRRYTWAMKIKVWTRPEVKEIHLGCEINSYAPAEI